MFAWVCVRQGGRAILEGRTFHLRVSMSDLPLDGFRFLGLAPDAGASAVRKAYALRLKQVDLEQDLAGFQALRAAYEAAMSLASSRPGEEPGPRPRRELVLDPLRVPAPEAAPEADPDPGPAPVPGPAPGPGPEPAPPPEPEPGEGAPPPGPRAAGPLRQGGWPGLEALEALDRQILGLRLEVERWILECDRMPTPQAMRDRLQECLDRPGAEDLGVRLGFERQVVDLLMDPFCPYEGVLLVAAARVFGWDRNLLGLGRLGGAGSRLLERVKGVDLDRLERQLILFTHRKERPAMVRADLEAAARRRALVYALCREAWVNLVAPLAAMGLALEGLRKGEAEALAGVGSGLVASLLLLAIERHYAWRACLLALNPRWALWQVAPALALITGGASLVLRAGLLLEACHVLGLPPTPLPVGTPVMGWTLGLLAFHLVSAGVLLMEFGHRPLSD